MSKLAQMPFDGNHQLTDFSFLEVIDIKIDFMSSYGVTIYRIHSNCHTHYMA